MADANLDVIDNRTVDSTGKMRPALSADSSRPDMVTFRQPAPNASEGDAGAPDAADAKDAATDAKTDADTKPDVKTEDPSGVEYVDETGKKIPYESLPPYVKRELTIARNKAKANENLAKAETAARQQAIEALAASQRVLDQLMAERAKPVVEEPPLERPRRDTFDSPEAYDTALVQWATEEAARLAKRNSEDARAAEEKKHRDDTEAANRKAVEEANGALLKTWLAAREKAMEEHPDFVEVTEAQPEDGGPTVTTTMAQAIMAAEDGVGPRIAYHLGKNVELSLKISKLPPGRQIAEIAKLELKLAEPPAPKVSKVPAPIAPVGSRNGASETVDPNKETMDQYAARRNRELRESKTGGARA